MYVLFLFHLWYVNMVVLEWWMFVYWTPQWGCEFQEQYEKSVCNFNNVGDIEEHVAYNIDRENGSFKFTKPVMIKSLKVEFDMRNRVTITPR